MLRRRGKTLGDYFASLHTFDPSPNGIFLKRFLLGGLGDIGHVRDSPPVLQMDFHAKRPDRTDQKNLQLHPVGAMGVYLLGGNR
jgi:hypothetical protein